MRTFALLARLLIITMFDTSFTVYCSLQREVCVCVGGDVEQITTVLRAILEYILHEAALADTHCRLAFSTL